MVRLKYDSEAFSSAHVKSDIARTFLTRILAFQYERRLSFFRRRHSHAGNYRLPKTAAQQAQPIGELRLSDGMLTVKDSVISAIQQQGISCDQLMIDSPSSSSTMPQRSSPSSRSNAGNNSFNHVQGQHGNTNCNNRNNRISISNPQNINATSHDIITARITTQQTRQTRRIMMPFQDNG